VVNQNKTVSIFLLILEVCKAGSVGQIRRSDSEDKEYRKVSADTCISKTIETQPRTNIASAGYDVTGTNFQNTSGGSGNNSPLANRLSKFLGKDIFKSEGTC
jgi:hypothetical protein